MPGTDGLEVCKRIRDHISCPILFLTARIEDTDKVKGFTVGGDDYIVKPFSLMELEARVRAHLRREARHNFEAQVKFSGDLTIDYSERCLFFGDKRVGLAKRNLILWNCFLKIQDRSLIKNGYMSVFGVMTARATAALWQSISAGYGLKLLHIPTIYMLKRFGGVDTNGSSKLPQALFISPKSLVLYIIAFVVLAVFLSVTTFSICGSAAEGIRASYPPSGEKYYLTNEQGEQLGDGAYIGTVPVPMSKEDERTIALLEKLPIVATPIYSAFCIIAAALLFYRNRLKSRLRNCGLLLKNSEQ